VTRSTGLRAGAAVVLAWAAATALQASGGWRSLATEPPVPTRLSETGLYAPRRAAADPLTVATTNRPFSPQYPLWTDGAHKRRWVYLPPGGVIDGSDESSWVLPVGTKFWKEFSFGGRRVETRMSWRKSSAEWVFVAYQWDADGADATLVTDGVMGAAELEAGKRHDIPSASDCLACHGTTKQRPLGFNALQLSDDRDPNAIHGEPLRAGMLTVAALVAEGRLSSARADIVSRPPRVATDSPGTRTVLGYLSSNCGTCHNGEGEIAALGPVVRLRELLADGDAVARRLVNQRTSWTVPGVRRGDSVVIDPAAPDTSAMLVRMRSRRPSSQMPPLGTAVRDDQAIASIERWIRGLEPRR
jgi:hypothetical protein